MSQGATRRVNEVVERMWIGVDPAKGKDETAHSLIRIDKIIVGNTGDFTFLMSNEWIAFLDRDEADQPIIVEGK